MRSFLRRLFENSRESAVYFGPELVLVQKQHGLFFKSTIYWDIAQRRVAIPYPRFGTTFRSHLHRSGNLNSRRDFFFFVFVFGLEKTFFCPCPQSGVGCQLRYASKLKRKNYNSANSSNQICWWVQVRRCEWNCQCHVETCSGKCQTNNQTRI